VAAMAAWPTSSGMGWPDAAAAQELGSRTGTECRSAM
jgi:hypothetical protein